MSLNLLINILKGNSFHRSDIWPVSYFSIEPALCKLSACQTCEIKLPRILLWPLKHKNYFLLNLELSKKVGYPVFLFKIDVIEFLIESQRSQFLYSKLIMEIILVLKYFNFKTSQMSMTTGRLELWTSGMQHSYLTDWVISQLFNSLTQWFR